VSARRNYLLALLTVIMVFNYADRLAMGLLLQNIKIDLSLSDTQLGLLTGIAFALFYAVMGIPIARWADRGNRVTIISLTVGLWSAAVALCGAAGNFVQLLLIRIGVAVGEAGCHPPAFSLIAEYFTRSERPRAVARYMLGWPLALLVGNFAAGWLNQFYGWRATFVFIAVPGLLLSALAGLTLKDPRQDAAKLRQVVPPVITPASRLTHEPDLKTVFVKLWTNRSFRHLLFCFSLSYFFSNGILQWQPAFFERSHGLNTGEIGTWFALFYGVGGPLGTYVGGELASRYAANNERLQLRSLGVLYMLLALVGASVYLVSSLHLAFAMLAVSALGSAALNGPLFAATQTLVPARMRAMAIAVVLFCSNLIGLGCGPLAAGALSDVLRPFLGQESLRYALLALCPGYFWCTWHLWQASRTVARDVEVAQAEDELRANTLLELVGSQC
jgi:MFS transporter, Spinster family, sphingosine-1-phosphate transporter